MPLLTGPHHAPKSSQPADSLMVLLHGRGSSGDDLIGLADFWADTLPNTAFHSPHGPQQFEDAPSGYQWYSRRPDQPRGESMREVTGTVNAFIDGLLAQYKLDPARCALVGFSQGTMLSLHLAPRRQVALGGMVGFSGVMFTGDTLKEELANKTPICLINGAEDPLTAGERTESIAALLNELEVPNEVHLLPGLGHSIDSRGLEYATQFLQGILGQP